MRYRYHYQKLQSVRRNWYIAIIIFFGILIFTFIHTTIVHTIVVGSDTMAPTLTASQRVIVIPKFYTWRTQFLSFMGRRPIQRGDIVSLYPPYRTAQSPIGRFIRGIGAVGSFRLLTPGNRAPGEENRLPILRRIIGLPGDTVRMENYRFQIRPAQSTLFFNEESGDTLCLPPADIAAILGSMDEITLGEDEYFVGADNRTAALDSRHWGVISHRHIRGFAAVRYWPIRAISIVSEIETHCEQ